MRPSFNAVKLRPVSALKQRIVPSGRRPVRIPFGIFRGLKFDIDFKSQMQICLGLYEFETYPHIRRALNKCRWIIGVGAGFGELCILFKKTSHQTFAVEPDKLCLSIFRSNMALNGIAEGEIIICAGYVGTSTNVDNVRIDEIQVDRSQPGFIKIDIEGLEVDALESATTLLRECNTQLLIEVHSLRLEVDCLTFLEASGYTCKIVDNSRWRLIIPENRPLAHNRWIWAEKRQ
jgi:hypothetical protein